MKQLLTGLLILGFFACKSDDEASKSKEEKVSVFYPFPQYLQEQVAYIDSMPLAIEYLRSVDGKRVDSTFFDKAEFGKLVAGWLEDDPNKSSLKNAFKEQSFQDLTLNTLTFTITSNSEKTRLQQADILLQPETKKVKNVILKRQWTGGDSTVTQTVFWVHNMKCQVSEEISFNSGRSYTQVKDFVWDRPI
jgi:hypothetical protein